MSRSAASGASNLLRRLPSLHHRRRRPKSPLREWRRPPTRHLRERRLSSLGSPRSRLRKNQPRWIRTSSPSLNKRCANKGCWGRKNENFKEPDWSCRVLAPFPRFHNHCIRFLDDRPPVEAAEQFPPLNPRRRKQQFHLRLIDPSKLGIRSACRRDTSGAIQQFHIVDRFLDLRHSIKPSRVIEPHRKAGYRMAHF